MTQQRHPRHDTTDQHEQVLLGVDTHKDVHLTAVITSTGLLLDTRSFPTTREGYRQLLSWARAFGRLQQAGVECAGSYGAALTPYLHQEDITVTEVNQPDKAARRRHGKSDSIDAAAAARAVLSGRATATATATATAKTTDGPVETIRLFKMAKTSAIKSRSMAVNQLKAVLVVAEPALRESLDGLSNPKLIRRCSQLRLAPGTGPQATSRHTLRLLAKRILHLTEEINDLTARISTAIDACAPKFLELYGVSPDTAAALLTAAGDNPDRLASEASFAALCGASPVEASSGKTQRRRLNRGGDRQAHSALCTIVIARLRWDTPAG
ncbi:IS110 family transposase [Streptomyces sp. NPDC058266]|uniref:IS110 family transposase n=1 Tax=Streptomyces sp. NPDC058266 TaxID=3346412 RepID=UPI0036E9E726